MSSYFVAQTELELAVFLLQAPKCQDYKSGPLYTAQIQFLIFSLCVYVVCLWLFTCGGQSLVSGCLIHFCPTHLLSPLGQGLSLNLELAIPPECLARQPLRSALPTPSVLGLQSHMPAFAWVLSPQVQVSMIEQQAFYAGSHLPNPSFLISTLTLRIEEELVRLGGTYL